MRQGEFWEALNAHQRELEADRMHIGELVRGAALRLWNLQVEKKSRITDARKFWPMPWDEMDDTDPEVARLQKMTDEERDAAASKFIKKIGWQNDGE